MLKTEQLCISFLRKGRRFAVFTQTVTVFAQQALQKVFFGTPRAYSENFCRAGLAPLSRKARRSTAKRRFASLRLRVSPYTLCCSERSGGGDRLQRIKNTGERSRLSRQNAVCVEQQSRQALSRRIDSEKGRNDAQTLRARFYFKKHTKIDRYQYFGVLPCFPFCLCLPIRRERAEKCEAAHRQEKTAEAG